MTVLSTLSSTICRLVPSGRVWLCTDDLAVSRMPILAMTQDTNGYLWLGSEDGPLLFDGLAWTAPSGCAALRGAIVRLFAASAEMMWVGTDGAGLAGVSLSAMPYLTTTLLTTEDGLPSNAVWALAVEQSGRVWVGSEAGLARVDEGQVRAVLTTAEGLPVNAVRALCLDGTGRLWVGSDTALALMQEGTVVATLHGQEARALEEGGGARYLCADGPAAMWVGTWNGTILRAVVGPEGRIALTLVRTMGERLRALCTDATGQLWAGTVTGAVALDGCGAVSTRITMAEGLVVPGIWTLCADRQGRIWGGTSTGLALLHSSPLAVQTLAVESMALSPVFAFAPEKDDQMWVATEGGVCRLRDEGSHLVACASTVPAALTQSAVSVLHRDARGFLWLGTRRNGLRCVNPTDGAVLFHLELALDVPALCAVDERYLWASMSGIGLVCVDMIERRVIREIGAAEGLPDPYVLSLHADGQGRIWAGTWSGWLVALDAQRGQVMATLALQPRGREHPVTHMAQGAPGELWVATYGGGLVLVETETLAIARRVGPLDGLPSDLVYSCLVDGHGHVWAGTRRGVVRYTPQTQQCTLFTRSLGLPHDECNAQALYLDAQERLWVGTVHGIGRIATGEIPAEVPPCALYLTKLMVLGQERQVAPDLVLEDSEYDLLFEYGALTFTAPAQVLYKVHLMGLEADWSAPTPQRSARYTNLRPGQYVFRVSARNWGGRWSPPLEAPFTVVRDRTAQANEDALEQVRIAKEVYRATAERLGELNRQLEETNALKTHLVEQAQLQAHVFERMARQDGLTGLLTRRALDEKLAEEFDRARRYGRRLSVALLDVDHFKAINDTFSHAVGDRVLQTVATLCQSICRSGDSVGRYGGEEIAIVLPETDIHESVEVCERLRVAIRSHDWAALAPGLRVTISSGVSDWQEAPDHEKMLADADVYLYQAKHAGRDRTCAK